MLNFCVNAAELSIMAFYITKSMLSKFNKESYQPYSFGEEERSSSSSDLWQQFDGKKSLQLSKEMICRVCARNGCTPLTEKLNSYDIISAIRSIANITIDLDDSLPKYICTECLDMLKVALNFKTNCETADKKFRKLLNPMGNPAFYSYPYSKNDFQLILHKMKTKQLKIAQEKEKLRMKREKSINKKMPKVKQFKCSPCDVVFSTKEKLMVHRRERQCMRRACDVCGQLVLSISHHMRQIHKQTVPHKCPTCNKEFSILARLKNHMMIHTNTFNFFCDLCPYKCKYKYYLVLHMRTHTGEKPYKCSQCSATFVNPSNLNKHKLTHQEKQYKCKMCEKAFRTNSALRQHREAAHLNIKHPCNLCGRDFCYKSDLRKHEIRSHNRAKRDYVGGEPAYKQWERMQKDDPADVTKWRSDDASLVQGAYIEPPKQFVHTNNGMYFSDVSGLIQHQPQMVQQQTVEIILPELNLKKDEVTIYETDQGIGYF